MMKIVACDDSMEDLEKIKGLLTRYMEINKSVRFEIEYFTDSAKLYHQIQGESWSGIYILDMIMSERTGIDIGTLIRSTDQRSVIIYITSSDGFAYEAYGVRAVRYAKQVLFYAFVRCLYITVKFYCAKIALNLNHVLIACP